MSVSGPSPLGGVLNPREESVCGVGSSKRTFLGEGVVWREPPQRPLGFEGGGISGSQGP